jgi:hypothetical protein
MIQQVPIWNNVCRDGLTADHTAPTLTPWDLHSNSMKLHAKFGSNRTHTTRGDHRVTLTMINITTFQVIDITVLQLMKHDRRVNS